MRLSLVIHEFPPLGGGAATAAAHLAHQLANGGHTVQVVTGGHAGASREHADAASGPVDGPFQLVKLPTVRFRRFAPSAVELMSFCFSARQRLLSNLRSFRPDLVMAFFSLPAGFLALEPCRRIDVPLVISLQGSDVPGFANGRLEGFGGIALRPLVRQALLQADFLVSNGQSLRDLAVTFEPRVRDKITAIASGVDCDLDSVPERDNAEFRLIQVGQLIRRKRVDLTIGAVDWLRRQGIPAQLTIVGDGPMRRHLGAMVHRLGLEDAVLWTGALSRAEIRSRLIQHDVFVLPSAAEGVSNAILEAMASGLPVVTTPNGSSALIASTVGGRVLRHADAEHLGHCLAELYRDPVQRRRFAEAALSAARERSWSDYASRHLQLFESCSARNSRDQTTVTSARAAS